MSDLSDLIISAIIRYAWWSGPIIGLLAFFESLVVIGLFVPAIATMVAVGGLIGAGFVDPAPVFACAAIGAILGDWLSYALGRSVGPAIYRHRWLRGHQLAFARARLFFRRYGFIAVLIGRFLGPIRSTVPVVAGAVKMPHIPFQIANILSALLWVPALLLPGYFAGGRLAQFDFAADHLMLAAIALCSVPLLMGWIALRLLNKPRLRNRTTATAS
ncbi:DedA family protein [Sphingobium sp. AP49]|uniref:DedA family protein n=1 Tax=Sphingobium sp. AP49 TaxID=1144307 RepID=UPI00026EDFB8|nr:DedA family protein [Sphingobium sp. AP49]WHO38312.1 DedA family protein [Sphingobium sp. AP49]